VDSGCDVLLSMWDPTATLSLFNVLYCIGYLICIGLVSITCGGMVCAWLFPGPLAKRIVFWRSKFPHDTFYKKFGVMRPGCSKSNNLHSIIRLSQSLCLVTRDDCYL
jgi:hypothetical protein